MFNQARPPALLLTNCHSLVLYFTKSAVDFHSFFDALKKIGSNSVAQQSLSGFLGLEQEGVAIDLESSTAACMIFGSANFGDTGRSISSYMRSSLLAKSGSSNQCFTCREDGWKWLEWKDQGISGGNFDHDS